MYHLVFQSSKHKQDPYRYYGRRRAVNRSSTFNQFELDTIRGSIKSRWEIFGAGSLPLQEKVWKVEDHAQMKPTNNLLHTHFNGHIITVEAPADAMWFRLNHENVSKNGCKLVEMYRDLDVERVCGLADEAIQLYSDYSNVTSERYLVTSISNYAVRLSNSTLFENNKPAARLLEKTTNSVEALSGYYQGVIQERHDLFSEKAREVFDYIASKRTEIA